MPVSEEAFLPLLKKALKLATGEEFKNVTLESRVSTLLNFSSLDLVDVFFELEKLAGKKLSFRELVLELQNKRLDGKVDLSLRELAQHLLKMGVQPE